VNELVRALERGSVVAIATESFFGLLADATSRTALDCLSSLKPRGADKAVGLILPTRQSWAKLVENVPATARTLADAFWPGPLTIAVRAAAGLDARLTVDERVAVRLPGESPASELARAFDRPVTATSANLPGSPPAVHSSEVEHAFAEAIADGRLVVAHGQSPGGLPSTLVAVDPGATRLLRQGAVPAEALLSVLGPLGVDLDRVASRG